MLLRQASTAHLDGGVIRGSCIFQIARRHANAANGLFVCCKRLNRHPSRA